MAEVYRACVRPVAARRPRSPTAATRPRPPTPPKASSRRSHRPRPLRAFGALAGCIRAWPHPPSFMGSRRFRTSGRVFLPPLGRYGRTAYPSSLQSEERTQRPKLVAIAESPLRSDSVGPGSFLERPRSAWRLRRPRRCCYGPLLRPAIRGYLARASAHHLTTSRGPRDEVLRNSATPTGGSGRRLQVWGRQIRNPKSEIRNSCGVGTCRMKRNVIKLRSTRENHGSSARSGGMSLGSRADAQHPRPVLSRGGLRGGRRHRRRRPGQAL